MFSSNATRSCRRPWFRWAAALCVLAVSQVAWAQATSQPVGVVCNVKVVSDKVKDVSSLEAWKKSYLKEGMSDKDKGIAIWERSAPLRKTPRMTTMNHRAGKMAVSPRKKTGMFSMGKMNPDRSRLGSMPASMAI